MLECESLAGALQMQSTQCVSNMKQKSHITTQTYIAHTFFGEMCIILTVTCNS